MTQGFRLRSVRIVSGSPTRTSAFSWAVWTFTSNGDGDVVEGKITRMTNFGAFVELDEGIEGLIHVSEFDDTHGGEKIDLQVGNNYQMKVIKLSPQERKIGLSIRALKSDEFRADWEQYQESEGTGTATLGDHFRNR